MKTVILLRHAKSSWKDPALPDHDRPLNGRGRKAAPVIGSWLAGQGYRPDVVLCSSARRAVETSERLGETLPGLPGPRIERALYHASPEAMQRLLAGLEPGGGTVLMIGHQPGIGALLRRLTGEVADPDLARAFGHFPTAAAAVVEFDIPEWPAIRPGQGCFVAFARPRDLVGD